MKALNVITLILIIVGGINWLLVGLFQLDLVAAIFGGQDSGLPLSSTSSSASPRSGNSLARAFSVGETLAERVL